MKKTLTVAAAVAALVLATAACKDPLAPAQPQPCASHQGLDGRWYDSYGELVDEDPCDGFDDHRKSPKSKPAPVKTPHSVKTASTGGGTGGRARRY